VFFVVHVLGEYVAIGDWGCQGDTPLQEGSVLVFDSMSGDVVLEKTVLGQIWAIDIGIVEKTKTMYVSAGSWSSVSNGSPGQVTTWSGKM
jgi:hypothetical protein